MCYYNMFLISIKKLEAKLTFKIVIYKIDKTVTYKFSAKTCSFFFIFRAPRTNKKCHENHFKIQTLVFVFSYF
jgi:hypothetical protein